MTTRFRYAVVILIALSYGVGAMSLLFTASEVRRAEQVQCTLITAQETAARILLSEHRPAAEQAARRTVLAEWIALGQHYGCT